MHAHMYYINDCDIVEIFKKAVEWHSIFEISFKISLVLSKICFDVGSEETILVLLWEGVCSFKNYDHVSSKWYSANV